MRYPLAFIAILAIALASAGCQALEALPPEIGLGQQPIVRLDAAGGRCVDGTCESVATIDADGTVTLFDGTVVQMPQERLARLVEAIAATDWQAILGVPFTGTCPTAFDGVERTWTIQTPGGPVRVADCTIAVDYDSPPFRLFIDELSAPNG